MNRDAWLAPATGDDVIETVAVVQPLVEPGASDDRIAVLNRAIASRGYTAAELRLVATEGPFANHYPTRHGAAVRLDVLDGIVKESRRLRAMLERVVTDDERAELVGTYPELDPDGFERAGHDGHNRPTWRYAPEVAEARRERTTTGETADVPGTPGGGAGWEQIAEEEAARTRAGMPERPRRRRSRTDGTHRAADAARAALAALGAPKEVLEGVDAMLGTDGRGGRLARRRRPKSGRTAGGFATKRTAPADPVRLALARATTPEQIAAILDAIEPTPVAEARS